jgi:hypothetical protein
MASRCGAYYDGVPRVIWAGHPPAVVIAGEMDASRCSGLVSALEGLADHEGGVHVNLAELAFCDLPGLASYPPASPNWPGRRGSWRQAPGPARCSPYLRRMLEILGWDCTPGLIMNEPPSKPRARPGMASAQPAPNRAALALTASFSAPGLSS